MEPFEIMISESQERMLCVVEPARVDDGARGLRALGGQRDGHRRGDGHAAGCACSPATRSSATCPSPRSSTTARPTTSSPRRRRVPLYPAPPRVLAEAPAPADALLALLGSRQPRLAPLGVRAVRLPRRLAHGAAARAGRRRRAGARRRRSRAPRARRLDRRQRPPRGLRPVPRRGRGGASSARPTWPASGAEPLGLTNCLNFGNPEKPHIAWQLSRAVAGLGDACRALGVPVVGGNVSLYNEGGEGPIYPTPVVGMVGELPDAARAGRLGFAAAGDAVALIAARSLGAVARRLRAGQAARRAARRASCRTPTSASCARCTPRCARPCARARCARRTTWPRAASPSRSPSAASRAGTGARARPRPLPGARGRGAAVRRGPGRVRRLGPARGVRGLRRRRDRARHGRRRCAAARRAARRAGAPVAELEDLAGACTRTASGGAGLPH